MGSIASRLCVLVGLGAFGNSIAACAAEAAAPLAQSAPNSQAYAFRIGTILLAGCLSFLGGLVFILCSQKDAKNSNLWYLRFWSRLFSRSALTRRVFLSNPFAPSPATPNLIFLANGFASMGVEIYRFGATAIHEGWLSAVLSHGAMVLVFTLVNTNNFFLALSLKGNGQSYALKPLDRVCIALAGAGIVCLAISGVQAVREGMDAGMPWVWIGLWSSVFVRAIAVFNFANFAENRLKALRNPSTRDSTPALPPTYGFHFFFAGGIIAWLSAPKELLRLLHPTVLLLQTGFVVSYLAWVHRRLAASRTNSASTRI
jgi:hypothetical protein